MSTDERYEGWANRETWAVALHINNDQGWQESVHEALRELVSDHPDPDNDEALPYRAGETIRENVEETLDADCPLITGSGMIVRDIGSLWRVDWSELGAAFLADLDE